MGMTVRMDIGRFKEQLRAKVDKLHAATRPAAQAGAEMGGPSWCWCRFPEDARTKPSFC